MTERDSIVKNFLTDRQRQVLWLVGSGLTNGQIAQNLGISIETVKNHLTSGINKLEEFGIITNDQRFFSGKIRTTSMLAAGEAAQNGLILPLPLEAKTVLEFTREYTTPHIGQFT